MAAVANRNEIYCEILRDELQVATGCTEPIAVAYAAARARELLGSIPTSAEIHVSGNILKNVKSVIVPNSGGLRGVRAALAAGVIAGNAAKKLQVLSEICTQDIPLIKDFAENTIITVSCVYTSLQLDITIVLHSVNHTSKVRIANRHTNIVFESLDDCVFLDLPVEEEPKQSVVENQLTIEDIMDFADHCDLEPLRDLLKRQIDFNSAIAREGMRGHYGAQVGRTLIERMPNDIDTRARAMAAAGSDARMNGCELPVVILSGSGNQGIAASVPVVEYAHYLGKSDDDLMRALLVSNLITVQEKADVGRLSAFCGAVSSGCGAAAGIAYLCGGDVEMIANTVTNALAAASGIICDGAKSSCAAKIALAVEAGLQGYHMSCKGLHFGPGEGIVAANANDTIANVGKVAKQGMAITDKVIIDIMLSAT
ncbi:MAG: L-serine ammonia-lyase, iron-sulfur-dependent, subunit alpha [Oscillospiraceae bacterium]